MILFFNTEELPAGKNLENRIKKHLNEKNCPGLVYCRNFIALAGHLALQMSEISLALLIVSDEREFDLFMQFSCNLRELKHILVLPEHDESLIAKAHLLEPRFLTTLEDNPRNLVEVFKKSMEIHAPRQ